MSVLKKLASCKGIKNDIPNQELAKELVSNHDKNGIREIAANLWSNDKAIQSDCIKVLYEAGYINPELIADHCHDFIKLLSSKNNRLVWGSMIALSTIAEIKAKELFENRALIQKTIEQGSVITVDAGIKTLSKIASINKTYNNQLFPYLMNSLSECRPKSVAQYSESIFEAVTDKNKTAFIKVLNERKNNLTSSQFKRVEKLLKKLS